MSRTRHRDRHGRGARGGLLPPYGALTGGRALPVWRSRSAAFHAVLQRVARDVAGPFPGLDDLQLGVEDAPPPVSPDAPGLVTEGSPGAQVPLARVEAGPPPVLVVYRRPVELRAEDPHDLADLLHEVVVEGVAELLGLDPDEVDPGQR